MNKNQSLISKHAKSFSWAGFFLSKETFRKCSVYMTSVEQLMI